MLCFSAFRDKEKAVNKKTKALLAQIIFLVLIIAAWQFTSYKVANERIFPSLQYIFERIMIGFEEKQLGANILYSLKLMLEGLAIGIVLAIVFSSISVISDTFAAIYNMIVSMFDLIPGIALISAITILFFNQHELAIVLLVIHSVVWPMSRSIIDGFNAVSTLHLEVGKNIGLNSVRLLFGVFIPAAMPRIFSGIKVGWARAWRGLISAEMVFMGFGVVGMGGYISLRRTDNDLASVYGVIFIIVIIGLIVEYGIFRTIEKNTFKKWGMTR